MTDGQQEEVTLIGLVNTILRHRRMVVLMAIAFAVLAVAWSLTSSRTFAATASFIPQDTQVSGGGAAALARQLGIQVGTTRPQSPAFYADVVRSTHLLRGVIESEYEVPGEDGRTERGTLVELFEVQGSELKPAWQKAVDRLRENMSVGVGSETGIVSVRVSTFSPALSEQIVARILEALHEFNLSTRRTQAVDQARFVSERVEEATTALDSAERALKDFLEHNRNFENSPELRFEHDRLQRQVAMRQELYISLLQSLEEAQIEAARDLAAVTIIDEPEDSARPQGRGTVLRGILGLLFGGFLGAGLAYTREALQPERPTSVSDVQELRHLVRETWADIRRPQRILRS